MPARRILVCDDDLPRQTFVEWFSNDARERAREPHEGTPRWMEVDGQVCRSLAELRDSLEQAVDAAALPDLVLIDDRLQPDRGGEPVRSALSAVRLIASKFGEERPKCVLHTSGPQLNDVWTFCALGGHNVVDKWRGQERMKILWGTIDGRRWEPQRRTEVRVADANGRLLPYMEGPHWMDEAVADLKATRDSLYQAKRRLLIAFDLGPRAQADEIVKAANAHGLAWVPLVYRHLLAENHPEHRPTAFRPRPPPGKSDS